MKQKTQLSKQTAKFIATIAQNLPELLGQEMQWWIDKPKALQECLKNALGSITQWKFWKDIKLSNGEIIDLVGVTIIGLGFEDDIVTPREIRAKAETFGLLPCPVEAGKLLFERYTEQPGYEKIEIVLNNESESLHLEYDDYDGPIFRKLCPGTVSPSMRYKCDATLVFVKHPTFTIR